MRRRSDSSTEVAPSATVRRQALDYLARREHGVEELRRKLLNKGHGPELVEEVLAALVRERLLSEQRFVESFVAARQRRGEGPLRIQASLRQRGVADELIAAQVDAGSEVWRSIVREVWHKRFRGEPPRDYRERARQARFLLQRGFTMEQVTRLLGGKDEWD
ncbi:MAG: regulatory protein RecX [Gammaproteobacteria bacterium]